jgi:hypothetical protein
VGGNQHGQGRRRRAEQRAGDEESQEAHDQAPGCEALGQVGGEQAALSCISTSSRST